MLILIRRIGEAIYIGDDIQVTVIDAGGNQARIGIQADRNIPVHREEVYYRIKYEKHSNCERGTGQSLAKESPIDSETDRKKVNVLYRKKPIKPE